MNKFKYQVIKLQRIEYFNNPPPAISGPYFYTVPDFTFPDKNYNNIHSFRFYSPQGDDPQSSKINLIEINSFKISDYEVIGERTPLKLFITGTSIKVDERFTEVNIPNNLQQLKCVLTAKTGAVNDVYIILRLNNVKPEEHFKNYFRYETKVIELSNTPLEKIKKFSFRPKAGAKRLKGVSVSFIKHNAIFFGTTAGGFIYSGYTGIGSNSTPVGKLSLQLNNLKSNPLLVNCRDYTIESITRKVRFIELDELVLPSSDIEGYFAIQPGATPMFLSGFTMYLTHKYSI